MTTAELDAVAAAAFRRAGARSAPQLAYGFPGTTASASTTRSCMAYRGRVAYGQATS